MSDDDVIDLRDYLYDDADSPLQYFSVWGGDGEHSRFSLPLWRAIYIAVGERAGLVWTPRRTERTTEVEAHFVLDLASEVPRTEFDPEVVAVLDGKTAPAAADLEDRGVVVFLGEQGDRRWYLVVDQVSADRGPMDRQGREDLLFLAGEAAGLLFHRGLTAPAEPLPEDPVSYPDVPDMRREFERLRTGKDPGPDPGEAGENEESFGWFGDDDDDPGPKLV